MKLGYARISTKDQSFDLQEDALLQYGCTKIYKDVSSGAKQNRPSLTTLLDSVREGDTIVVWKLDRLGRSLQHLVEFANMLIEKKIDLVSLNDPIDTTTSQGIMVFHIFSAIAQFERDLIRERTNAGLSAARARGRLGGKPKGLSKQAQAIACAAETLYLERELTIKEICEQLSISKKTLYNYLRYRDVEIGGK